MALQKQKFTDIPADAVVLSENEALEYQLKILRNWKNTTDVIGFKYGGWLLAGASFVTGVFLNNHFRRKLKLLHYGKFATYIPNCVIPASMCFLFHVQLVTMDVVLMKNNFCPLCIEMRASAIQALFGCVFPTILTPIACYGMAHRYGTYNMPYITQDPRKVLELTQKIFRPISRTLLAIFIGQALVGSAVTYLEARSVFNVNMKLAQLEKQLENQ